MYAIDKNNEEMLKALIDRGADVNYANMVFQNLSDYVNVWTSM